MREDEVILAPGEQTSKPMIALKETLLWKISSCDEAFKPIIEPAGVGIAAKIKVRVSEVHKLSTLDSGDGLVHSSTGEAHYLIVACPRDERAEGLLIQKQDCKPVTEKQYLKEKGSSHFL